MKPQGHLQLSPTPLWPREADIECALCRAQVKAPAKKLKQQSSGGGASEWYGPGRPGYLGKPQTLTLISNTHGCKHIMHAICLIMLLPPLKPETLCASGRTRSKASKVSSRLRHESLVSSFQWRLSSARAPCTYKFQVSGKQVDRFQGLRCALVAATLRGPASMWRGFAVDPSGPKILLLLYQTSTTWATTDNPICCV